jgi:serine/threonine protein kinase/Tol biopolymer transport system component
MPLHSGTRLGPYEILTPLGAGGMGEVYRARDTRLDRFVAIKVVAREAVSPHALERFEREAKAIAALNHPRICSIHDIGTSPVPFLVMELLDGETLHERLTRGPVDVQGLVDIGLALADALSAAHLKGIVHRDLKPANIVLTVHGPKILDFGLARITEPVSASDVGATLQPTVAAQGPITDAGVAVGTVAYMSPEQLRGETLDARTDLFSLGVVLYELATGRRAFSGATSAAVSAAILYEQPAPPRQLRPELPARLEQALLTLLEKDRDVRMQTASELRAELTRIRREMSGSRAADAPASPPAAVPTAAPSDISSRAAAPPSSSDVQLVAGLLSRHRVAAASTAVVLLLAILGAGYVAWRPAGGGAEDGDPSAPSISDLEVQQLTTSGTAATPVISPDGSYVAYVEQGPAGNSLRVRQVATGSNVEILPAEPGVQLLAPAVTPDGTFVTYMRRAPARAPELWQIPLIGGSAPRRLLTGIASGAGFSADGRMAYVRTAGSGDTEVVIAGADGSGGRVLATRRLPASGFMNFNMAGGVGWFAPAWSPDGTTLAVFGVKAIPTGQVVFLDTQTGVERAAFDVGSPIVGISLAWLDSDTLILSMLQRSSDSLQLWLLSYPQGGFTRLTNDVSQYVGLTITADRNEVVTSRSDVWFSIWTTDDASGEWTETIPKTPVKGPIGFGVRWVGDDLIYASSASGVWGLERWRAATRTTEVVLPRVGAPQVSRDGATIAFFDYDAGEFWTMDADGRNRVLADRGNPGVRITPDGRQVTRISAAPGKPLAVSIRPIGSDGEAREITSDRVRPGSAQVSPDGRWIAFPAVDDRNEPVIAVCELASCTSRRTFPFGSAWTPDSQGLAYADPRTQSDIWVQPLDGRAPRQLTRFPPDGLMITNFSWSADGTRLAVARGATTNDIVLFRGLRRAR